MAIFLLAECDVGFIRRAHSILMKRLRGLD